MSTVMGRGQSDEQSSYGNPPQGLQWGSSLRWKDVSMGSSRGEAGERFAITVASSHTHGPLIDGFLAGTRLPCFLGLSPTTSFVNRARLAAILRWLTPRSQEVLIVEGTYSSRWNLMALGGLNEHAAIDALRPTLDRFRRRVSAIVSSFRNVAVSILDWPVVLASDDFQCIQKALMQYSERHPKFASAVSSVAVEYVTRVHNRKVSTEAQHQLLRSYVLEELAVFLYLYSIGYHVEVYPGADLGIMKSIADGEFPSFPIACRERSHVGIRLTRE